MSFAKELLKLSYEKFPILDDTHHLIVYDQTSDQLTLILSVFGAMVPVGLTDDELEKNPKEVIEEIVILVTKRAKEVEGDVAE